MQTHATGPLWPEKDRTMEGFFGRFFAELAQAIEEMDRRIHRLFDEGQTYYALELDSLYFTDCDFTGMPIPE